MPPNDSGQPPAGFSVLYICHANRCRSAAAELLLIDALRRTPAASGWTVRSAGVGAIDGQPVVAELGELLSERGIDASAFRSETLDAAMVAEADLILTAERGQRAAVLALDPSAHAKTFTMVQFERLTAGQAGPREAGSQPPDGSELITAALAQRGLNEPLDPADDDIADPVGHGRRAIARAVNRIDRTVAALVGRPAPEAATEPTAERRRPSLWNRLRRNRTD